MRAERPPITWNPFRFFQPAATLTLSPVPTVLTLDICNLTVLFARDQRTPPDELSVRDQQNLFLIRKHGPLLKREFKHHEKQCSRNMSLTIAHLLCLRQFLFARASYTMCYMSNNDCTRGHLTLWSACSIIGIGVYVYVFCLEGHMSQHPFHVPCSILMHALHQSYLSM